MFSIFEFLSILQWWAVFFVIGAVFFPLTNRVFNPLVDRGYLFSKVLGLGLVSYLLLVLNIFHILPFGLMSILLIIWICAITNYFLFRKKLENNKLPMKLIIFEEILFLLGIFIWSFVRAHEPSLNGLEKFMDFGFLNSIIRTTYQPAVDMWFSPLPINYYYFGHLTTAVLTKLSFLPSYITYNLMIATLFSFCFSLAFSLGINLISRLKVTKQSIAGGLLIGALVSLAGNLHTIYAFFKAYNVDHPLPFWNLSFLPNTFPNAYWYPNATRFIPFTIHEFPIYSFVVSDLHGHVVDIMYVLLSLALIYVLLIEKGVNKLMLILISLFLAIMYMTNAWDGAIYMIAVALVLGFKNWQHIFVKKFFEAKYVKTFLTETAKPVLLMVFLFLIFSLPFNLNFQSASLVHGIGIVCAPTFLTNIGKFGPFLFETNHCQKSAWWELLTLYGFFYFFVISFLVFIIKQKQRLKLTNEDLFIIVLIIISTFLIIIPEFFYVKDIYPAHYRANTMFKLVYQAFMMLSIASGFIIVRIMRATRNFIFYLATVTLLGLVFIFPYFAVKSYYGDLKTYSGLDGLKYLKTRYPQDYDAINWINANISGRPVMVEAQGDSYTDYERISANTGLPTILGWTVHEWLWRGSYDIPAPRITEVQNIYVSPDLPLTKNLLNKYDVKYVYVGGLEHQKYPNLIESKFAKLGKVVWQESGTKIYKITN